MSLAPTFTVDKNAFPSFSKYYTGDTGVWGAGIAGTPPNYTGDISFWNIPSFQLNGSTYVPVFLFESQTVDGQVTEGPTPSREIIFHALADGTFVDVTDQFFGPSYNAQTGVSINGIATEVVPVQLSTVFGLVIAESREDGRGENATSSNVYAQSQVEILQSDGTLKTINIGQPIWGDVGSIDVVGDTVFLTGITPANQSFNLNGATLFTGTGGEYQLSSDGSSFVNVGSAPIVDGGIVVDQSHIITLGYINGSQVFAAFDQADGKWTLESIAQPYLAEVIDNVIGWNNQLGPANIIHYGSGVLVGAQYVMYGPAVLNPGQGPIVASALIGSLVSGTETDGNYHFRDGSEFLHLDFWSIAGNQLIKANVNLIGEDATIGPVGTGVQFLDLNGDGLLDVVVSTENHYQNGNPIVYMNDGSGDFIHVDNAVFPDSGLNYAFSTFIRVGASWELVSTPTGAGPQWQNQPIVETLNGSFPFGIFSLSSSDLTNNIAVFETLANEGRLTSIALTDAADPVLTLTAAQALGDALALQKITNISYSIQISGVSEVDYIKNSNLTILRAADSDADAASVVGNIKAGTTSLENYLSSLANHAKDTASAILSIFEIMGATADSASLTSETNLISSINDQFSAAAGWVAIGASLADSKFAPKFVSDYKSLTVDDFINKVTLEAFGTTINNQALHAELTVYQDFFQHYADATDPTGENRARGGFIADMLHQASDYAAAHPGSPVGHYEQASAVFLVGLVEGTTHYGDSIFA